MLAWVFVFRSHLRWTNHQTLHQTRERATGEVLPELERGAAVHESVAHGIRDEVQRVDGRWGWCVGLLVTRIIVREPIDVTATETVHAEDDRVDGGGGDEGGCHPSEQGLEQAVLALDGVSEDVKGGAEVGGGLQAHLHGVEGLADYD